MTGWIEALGQELLYSARGLCKSLVFTLVAVLTLALGIGGTTTIFSAIDALLPLLAAFAKSGTQPRARTSRWRTRYHGFKTSVICFNHHQARVVHPREGP